MEIRECLREDLLAVHKMRRSAGTGTLENQAEVSPENRL